MTADDPLVCVDVLQEHLDEAEFRLEQFERLLDDPVRTLSELAGYPESQLLAHLDGLALGGPATESLLASEFEPRDGASPSRVSAAALAEIQCGRGARLLPRLAHDVGPVRAALVRAFALAPDPGVERFVQERWSGKPTAIERAGLLDIMVSRRMAVPPVIATALQSEEPLLVASAARAARPGASRAYLSALESLLDHRAPVVREAALVTALCWGSARAWSATEHLALAQAQPHVLGMTLFGALASAKDLTRLTGALRHHALRASALFALGFSGSVAVVPSLLAHLRSSHPRTAKLAAQAIAQIIGLDLTAAEFIAPTAPDDRLPDAIAKAEEDELEMSLALTPEDVLPMPNASAIETYWEEHRPRFDPDARYVRGSVRTEQSLLHQLEHGPLRGRDVWSLLLAAHSRGAHWIDTRAFTAQQQAQLAQVGKGIDVGA